MNPTCLKDITTNITHLTTVLRLLMTSVLCGKLTPRDTYTTNILSRTLTLFYSQYIPVLLTEKEYQACSEFNNVDLTKKPLISLFMDENIYNVGHTLTSTIFKAKNTSPDALELCHVMRKDILLWNTSETNYS